MKNKKRIYGKNRWKSFSKQNFNLSPSIIKIVKNNEAPADWAVDFHFPVRLLDFYFPLMLFHTLLDFSEYFPYSLSVAYSPRHGVQVAQWWPQLKILATNQIQFQMDFSL